MRPLWNEENTGVRKQAPWTTGKLQTEKKCSERSSICFLPTDEPDSRGARRVLDVRSYVLLRASLVQHKLFLNGDTIPEQKRTVGQEELNFWNLARIRLDSNVSPATVCCHQRFWGQRKPSWAKSTGSCSVQPFQLPTTGCLLGDNATCI